MEYQGCVQYAESLMGVDAFPGNFHSYEAIKYGGVSGSIQIAESLVGAGRNSDDSATARGKLTQLFHLGTIL